MIGQMAISIPLPGFNDLGHSVTPIFVFMDSSLPIFSVWRRNKKIYQIYHRIPFICAAVSNISWRVKFYFVKTLAKFGTIYVTDPLVQNMTKNTRLRWPHSLGLWHSTFLSITPCGPWWITLPFFYLWNEFGDSHFFPFPVTHVTHHLPEKKSIDRKSFAWTSSNMTLRV